ncbi:MAG TPA: hypothetical protein VFS42_06135 [Burkholderiaceae bacterium]|nr:hypothetical protein [Burkholderiaceae bacterium]
MSVVADRLSALTVERRALASTLAMVRERVLGVVGFGAPLVGVADDVPHVAIATPALVGDPVEVWCAEGMVTTGRLGPLRYAHDGHVLFACVEIEDGDMPSVNNTQPDAMPLQRAAQRAYEWMFKALAHTGYTHPLRCWNYFSAINQETSGLERYRQFNIGRQDAFLAFGRSAFEGAPAACALGAHGGGLVVYVIAAKQAPLPIENPRQVSAYRYPNEYGPRTPSFSRAALARFAAHDVLLISGTASIVGHATAHAGDVRAQTRETLNNLRAVVEQANHVARCKAFSLEYADLKVYVRHARDVDAIRDELARALDPMPRMTWLLADVCRHDLLVEIEAMASVAKGEE